MFHRRDQDKSQAIKILGAGQQYLNAIVKDMNGKYWYFPFLQLSAVGEVVAADIAEKIKVITNGGGTSQPVLDELASLQAQINLIASALVYKGTWNASTNTPTLTSSVGTANTFYIVSVAGTTNLNGTSNWGVGDWAVYNGTVWQRVEGGAVGNFTDLSVSGTTTLSNLTASTALALNASKEVVSVTNTGSGNNVLATSPTLTTPNLGTPTSVTLTNGTGLPLSTGVTGTLPIANGGTGQTTATNAFNALAPSQASNSGKYLTTNGTTTSWATVSAGVTSVAATVPSFLSVSGSPITSSGTLAFSLSGTALPTTSGGTGLTSFTNKGVPYATSTSALTTGTALQFDGNNLGVSTTPSAWGSDFRAIDLGTRASFSFDSNLNQTGISSNIYNAVNLSRPYYKTNGVASQYLQSSGDHVWSTAPSGIANPTTTITSGNIYTNITSGNQTSFGASNNTVGTIWTATSSGTLSSGTVVQNVDFVESMRIDSSSNVGIGISTPGSKLDVKGTLRLSGSTSGYVGLAPASAAGSTTYTLPSADGTNGQALTTNGSGTLSWATAASGTVTSVAMTVPAFLSVTGSPITSSGTLAVSLSGTALPIANGGTGQTTANAALNALLPSQTGNGNKYLQTNGTDTSWDAVSLSTADITGTLGTGNGGTGLTAFTLNGVVYATSTSALATGNALQFDGTNLLVGTTTSVYNNTGRSCIELNGSTDSLIAFKSGGTSSGYLVGGSATLSLYAAGASTVLTFGTNGQERLRIDASGNVGIGVSAGQKFHVENNANSSTWMKVSNTNANSGAAAGVLFANNTGDLGAISLLSSGNSPSNGLFLRSLSTNLLVFGTNNNPHVYLDSSGNLGIGTSSPVSKLDILGSSTPYIRVRDATGALNIGIDTASSNVAFFNSKNSMKFLVADGSIQAVTVDSSGNVGIGTTSPSQKLEVSGAIRATITPSNSVQASLLLANSGTTSAANLQLNTSGGLAIWNYQNGGVGWFNSATIDTSGNVGIGTTSPAVKLDVVGASAGATVSQFTSNETGTTTSLAVFQRSGGAVAAAIKYNATNSPLTIDFGTTTSHALTFLTANTERARIDSSGTFRVKGAGTAGSTDAVQFSGSAPANAMSLSSSGNLLIGTTSTTGGYPLRAKGGGVDGSTTVTVPSGVTTTIYTIPNTATACMCVVFGDNGSNGFCDLLFFLGNTTPQVVSSKTMYGSPPARTYSVASTTQLQLNVAMDSSTRTAVLGTIS